MTLALFVVSTLAGCLAVKTFGENKLEYPDEIDVVRRSAWGWQSNGDSVPEHTISKITIHHGGVAFSNDRDPVEYLRSLQNWSRKEQGWMDIPYHFVIDLQGKVYEARPLRFPGDTNTAYDPRTHALIVVVGNYEIRELTETQFESLSRLTAFLATEYSVKLSSIRSHKDYTPDETTCPGANIYRYLEDGSLVRRVYQIIGGDP